MIRALIVIKLEQHVLILQLLILHKQADHLLFRKSIKILVGCSCHKLQRNLQDRQHHMKSIGILRQALFCSHASYWGKPEKKSIDLKVQIYDVV